MSMSPRVTRVNPDRYLVLRSRIPNGSVALGPAFGTPTATGGLRAREPLLEGGGECGIAQHLHAVLFRLAATHQHPVEAFGGSAHGDIGLGMTDLGRRLTDRGPQDPFALAVGAVDMKAR